MSTDGEMAVWGRVWVETVAAAMDVETERGTVAV